MKIKRMTSDAWAVAQDLVSGAERQGFRPVRKRTHAELRSHGIIGDGEVLDPEWQRLLAALVRAPVALRVVASKGSATFHTEVAVLPDVALAVTRRGTSSRGTQGERAITGAEMAVEVVLFTHEEVWPVIRRVIPELPALRAEPDTSVVEDPLSVSAEDQARVTAIVKQRHGAPPSSREALELMRDPDPRLFDVLEADADVCLFGLSRRPAASLALMTQWSVGRQGLYVSRVDADEGSLVIAEVASGHLAAEVERVLARLITFARHGSAAA